MSWSLLASSLDLYSGPQPPVCRDHDSLAALVPFPLLTLLVGHFSTWILFPPRGCECPLSSPNPNRHTDPSRLAGLWYGLFPH